MALGCAGAALVAAGCGLTASKTKTVTATHTVTVTHTVTTTSTSGGNFCTGSDLTATFDVLEGSAGAGNIVYTLTLKNTSQEDCAVTGMPQVQLLDANGAELPTHVLPSGTGTAVYTLLHPGDTARATARFSPDVDPCGKTPAATLRVTPNGGGTIDAAISPATRVCQDGSMQWSNLSTAA
jgi:uncharacterized protein DUF4232